MDKVEAWCIRVGPRLIVGERRDGGPRPCWEQRLLGWAVLRAGCWLMRLRLGVW